MWSNEERGLTGAGGGAVQVGVVGAARGEDVQRVVAAAGDGVELERHRAAGLAHLLLLDALVEDLAAALDVRVDSVPLGQTCAK